MLVVQIFSSFSEINKVRSNLFHLSTNKEPLNLPQGSGPIEQLSEKLYVPVKDYPEVRTTMS